MGTNTKKAKKENPIVKEFIDQSNAFIETMKNSAEMHDYAKNIEETIRRRGPRTREEIEQGIKKSVHDYRALIIEATIMFETIIDEVLCEYFCLSASKGDFIKMCLEKDFFTLHKKIDLARSIARKLLPKNELFSRFGEDYSSLLDNIAEQRNKCAHVAFKVKKFDIGDVQYFGDSLNEKETNKISSTESFALLLFGASFAGSILAEVLNLRKRKWRAAE